MTAAELAVEPSPPLTGGVLIEVNTRVNITAATARQRANRFALLNLSSQVGAGTPRLLVGEPLCWFVPLYFTLPGVGEVGRVGEVLVDADTGEVLAGPDDAERMNQHGKRLAQRAAP